MTSLLQKPLHRYGAVHLLGKCLVPSYIRSKGQCPFKSIKPLTLGPDFRPEKKVRRKRAERIDF